MIGNYRMMLHSGDNSHPNLNGSYLAACVFYAVMFGKSPEGLPYTAGLAGDSALILQQAADSIVFGYAQSWNLWNDLPVAGFESQISTDTLFTDNTSTNSSIWHWDFGDGNFSGEYEPIHIYSSQGSFNVSLTACDSCRCDTVTHNIQIIWSVIPEIKKEAENKITLVKQPSGKLMLKGYNGSGELRIYDLAGRIITSLVVSSGYAPDPGLPGAVYLWQLTDQMGNLLSHGKLAVNR